MEKAKRMTLWTPNFIRVFLTNLMLMLISNGIPSVFTLYLFSRGGTDMDSGIATSCYYFIALIARPLAGWLLDHRSRRKVVIAALAGLVIIPWAFVIVPWVALILVCRTVHGALAATCSTGLTTNAYDTLDREFFSEGVGYFGFSNAIATAVGPAMGLWLFRRYGAPALFAMCSAACLIGLVLMCSFRYMPVPRSEKHIYEENFFKLLVEKDALPASVLEGFCAMMSGAVSTYIAVYFIANGNFTDAGRYFAMQAAGTFFSRFFVGKISDRRGEGPLVWSSSVLFLCGICAIIFAKLAWLVYLGALCMGVGYGFTVTGMQIMSVRIVKPERRGAAASTYTCFWDISAAVGGLAAGILVTLTKNYQTMFLCMSAVYPLYLLTYLLWARKHPSAFRNWKKSFV